MAFRERQLVVLVVDLANFTRAVAGMEAGQIAEVVDRYFIELGRVVSAHSGEVVKWLGDGCLAVFEADRATDAVAAARAAADRVRELAGDLGLPLEMGANIHLCTVADGALGPEKKRDIIGAGVIFAFRMGAGAGVRISEPVYRKLPSDQRSGWEKYQPPAVYTLTQ